MKKQAESLGNFEQIVMAAVVALRDDAYGMAVHAKVLEVSGRPVKLGPVYVTLDRMEQKGLLSSSFTEPMRQRGGRSRRVYRLSASGKLAVKESAETARRVYETVETFWSFGKWKPSRAK